MTAKKADRKLSRAGLVRRINREFQEKSRLEHELAVLRGQIEDMRQEREANAAKFQKATEALNVERKVLEARIPTPAIAAAFNEWMRRYVDDPDEFERDWETVSVFLAEERAGREPSYGETAAELLITIAAEVEDGIARRRTKLSRAPRPLVVSAGDFEHP